MLYCVSVAIAVSVLCKLFLRWATARQLESTPVVGRKVVEPSRMVLQHVRVLASKPAAAHHPHNCTPAFI